MVPGTGGEAGKNRASPADIRPFRVRRILQGQAKLRAGIQGIHPKFEGREGGRVLVTTTDVRENIPIGSRRSQLQAFRAAGGVVLSGIVGVTSRGNGPTRRGTAPAAEVGVPPQVVAVVDQNTGTGVGRRQARRRRRHRPAGAGKVRRKGAQAVLKLRFIK